MTVERLRPVAEALLTPWVKLADRIGLTPNGVSLLALGCAGVAGASFYLAGTDTRWYLFGAAFVLVNGWLDLIDGALARKRAIDSPRGDLIDHAFDRYADILIVVGLAAGIQQFFIGILAITGVLMTSYLGTQAIAVGMDRVYGGLLGRADRLVLIGVVTVTMLVVPDPVGGLTLVGWLLVVLAVVGHLTAVQRFILAIQTLE